MIHGKAKHVTACEWNVHAICALRYNSLANGNGEDRVTILEGDCRANLERLLWEKEEMQMMMDLVMIEYHLGYFLVVKVDGLWPYHVLINNLVVGYMYMQMFPHVNDTNGHVGLANRLLTLHLSCRNNGNNGYLYQTINLLRKAR